MSIPHLSPDYYHCFLGNGLDAVLVGYTGSMVADKVGVDRCAWYKADRYYPEDRLVHVAGRFPMDQPLQHAPGSGWYEIAPLGRSWYEVYLDSERLQLQASTQHLVPQEGTLCSELDYGPVHAQGVTFLHATRSLLVEHYAFDRDVEFLAWMGPGVWVEEGWDTDPFYAVEMLASAAEGRYDLGETRGRLALGLVPAPERYGAHGRDRWLSARGRTIVKYFCIVDDRQGAPDASTLEQALALGYDALRAEHLAFWRAYAAASSIHIPDVQFQRCYEASQYHFKAMQNRASGGLPVNNLRRTWSSHVFWDSYFVQRALLEANHRPEALEACRFFQRTVEHARRHARDEFGSGGLKWDWEITHDGRKAYGTLLHMKDQVHNNASYANEIWQYYEFTQDLAMLREFYPILEGIARFFLACVVEPLQGGYGVRPLVGVHESPVRVRNEGMTLAGTIAILRHVARAAHLLGVDAAFARQAAEAAGRLVPTLDRLYNGRFFASAEGSGTMNASSLAPIYPMRVVPVDDPRSVATARAFTAHLRDRLASHGSPWAAGMLATILARQACAERRRGGEGDAAWEVIETARPAICQFGGMTEVMEQGRWNMQYFGTAQGAVCTALHSLLLQAEGDELRLFPALPSVWREAGFERLLAAGLEVSAEYAGPGRPPTCTVRNVAPVPLSRVLHHGSARAGVSLQPGEERCISWA